MKATAPEPHPRFIFQIKFISINKVQAAISKRRSIKKKHQQHQE